ncbi:metal-dependent hydrolase [Alkalibacillus sp. S2W]|uniref:metal-dependent hydrolase n=1 Tax=Alkalibacillus sp. S2W TaxID=3386553 RepID=UPI00398CD4B3
MMAKGHQAMGLTWGVAALTFESWYPLDLNGVPETLLFLAVVLIGALLPDVDSKQSKIGRYVYPIFAGVVALIVIGVIWRPEMLGIFTEQSTSFLLIGMGLILLMLTSHRTWTHSLVFVVLVGVALTMLQASISISETLQYGFLIGVVSHIFGDFLTKQGVPLLYPLSQKKFKFILSFRTGSPVENVVVMGLVGLCVWMLASSVMPF